MRMAGIQIVDDQLSHSRKSSVHDGDCAGLEVVEGSP